MPFDVREFRKLATAASEAHFSCGDWDRNDTDEPYDDVFTRATAADAALEKYVLSHVPG